MLLSALQGLTTLAIESISSYLKGQQEKCIVDAVTAMRQDHMSVKNRLQQYSNDFLMYGRYNVQTLDKVTDTVNFLHHHQTELESVFQSTELGHIDDVMEAMSFGFDPQMYLTLTQEEPINQYHLLEDASKIYYAESLSLERVDCHMNCSLTYVLKKYFAKSGQWLRKHTLIIKWPMTIFLTTKICS